MHQSTWMLRASRAESKEETKVVKEPDHTQFFRYDSMSLSCEDRSEDTSGGWTVWRKTAKEKKTKTCCGETWGETDQTKCFIKDLTPLDSGQYWCEGHGSSSEPVHITVTDRTSSVSPAPPSSAPQSLITASPLPSVSPSPLLLSSIIGPVLLVLLVLLLVLVLLKRRSSRRTTVVCTEEDGVEGGDGGEGVDDVTYSHLFQQQPVGLTELEPSPVYSAVKTQEVLYSDVTVRGAAPRRLANTDPEVVYSSVKTLQPQL